MAARSGDIVILASAARTATNNSRDIVNSYGRGVVVFCNVGAAPGIDTVTLTIKGKGPISGLYYTILTSAALVATGLVVLRVYPGLVAAANLTVNDVLPKTFAVTVTHSAGGSFTYSVAANIIL